MENVTTIPENVIEFSRRILEKKYDEIAKQSAAVIISTAFDVISEYRAKGMSFEQIAKAYSENGVPIKTSTLKWAYGKAKKARDHLATINSSALSHEPAIPPTTLHAPPPDTSTAPAATTVTASSTKTKNHNQQQKSASPSCLTSFEPELLETMRNDPSKRPPPPDYKALLAEGLITEDEIWEKIDKIINNHPTPEMEYPEIKSLRKYRLPGGRIVDLCSITENDLPVNMRSLMMKYPSARMNMFEEWGIIIWTENGAVVQPTRAKHGRTFYMWPEVPKEQRPVIKVNLDAIIAAHCQSV